MQIRIDVVCEVCAGLGTKGTVVQVKSVGAMISRFDETPAGQGGEGMHVGQGTKAALGVFNMDNALEVAFMKGVENFEH